MINPVKSYCDAFRAPALDNRIDWVDLVATTLFIIGPLILAVVLMPATAAILIVMALQWIF